MQNLHNIYKPALDCARRSMYLINTIRQLILSRVNMYRSLIQMTDNMTAGKTNKTDFGTCMQNRELSWLKFNERVLEEAAPGANPPLERLKFISVFTENLDEFFMIRVGSLTDYMLFAPDYFDNKTGMNAGEQLDAVFRQMPALCALRDRYCSDVEKDLARSGLQRLKMSESDPADAKQTENYFVREILPLLSPQIIDAGHPFPHIDNKRLHIAVTLVHKNNPVFGLIAMPNAAERLYFPGGGNRYILLEDIVFHYASLAFHPYKITEKTILAVTRNADLNTEKDDWPDEKIDYRKFMQQLLKKRRRLAPVRLELQYDVGGAMKSFFCEKLNVEKKQVFLSSCPLDLSYYIKLEEKAKTDEEKMLIRAAHIPADTLPAEKKQDIIKRVLKKDMLFSYPYESFSPFLDMLRNACEDPAVISIKTTLYRIDVHSKMAETLIRAAENGKDVIVLMELRARFDEENNIEWSQRFEEAGCRVIYGLPGYKVHSKICLITRKDRGQIQYITQIGTGNYNEKTVRLYTDLSIITANREIGEDAALFFNGLLLGEPSGDYNRFLVAPGHFKQEIIRRIERERDKARSGEAAGIVIKCNSLTDREVIMKLIEASQCGVSISMIVRGICCLIPRIPGYTENITVISIVGRFLEHSRIYCFGAGDDKELYISSADLMTRNTERRVEIACPVSDPEAKGKICGMLETMLSDNIKAWEQFSDGGYVLRKPSGSPAVNSQEIFIEKARVKAESALAGGGGGGKVKRSGFFRNIVKILRQIFSGIK